MTKFPKTDKYIAFWKTKESLPDTLDKSINLLAPLLKMIEEDPSIIEWGRCEAIKVNNRLVYQGFILFKSSRTDFKKFCLQWSNFIDITRQHKYYSVNETQDFLLLWKNRIK